MVDPWFDRICLEKRCLKLDEAYREISKYSNRRKKHDGFRDINMLRKIHAVRILYHQSLVMRSKDYQVMLSEGEEARRIWHTEMLPFCSKASYFRPCCRKTMKFTKRYEHNHPKENGNTYTCREKSCARELKIAGKSSRLIKRKLDPKKYNTFVKESTKKIH